MDEKKPTVGGEELTALLQDWANFTMNLAKQGKAMPTPAELFMMARIANIEKRIDALEEPPVIVAP